MTRSPLFGMRVLAAALLAFSVTATGSAQTPVASFSAIAIVPEAPVGSAAQSIDITITRWSTAAERERVQTILLEQGADKLLEAFREMPDVARLGSPAAVSIPIRYAVESKSNGIQRILLLTDRPVGVWEAQAGGRSLDYPFMVIELRIRPNGTGDGTIAVAARMRVDTLTKEVSFVDYSVTPVQLQGVRRDR